MLRKKKPFQHFKNRKQISYDPMVKLRTQENQLVVGWFGKTPHTREPTCGWMVRRVVAPLAHQSSNPGFDTLVSHKDRILFSGRRRSRQQRGACGDFINLKARHIRSLTQSLGGAHRGRVGCVCVHRGECVRVCVSVFDSTVLRKTPRTTLIIFPGHMQMRNKASFRVNYACPLAIT